MKQHTEAICFDNENFSKSFMYSIHQLYFLVQKHLEQTLINNHSISFSQFMILVGCSCKENDSVKSGVSQLAIAEKLSITEATVSRHISTLVDLGYLLRQGDKENRRKHVISLTKEGEKIFNKTKHIIDKELEIIFETIEEKDKKIMTKNITKIITPLLNKKESTVSKK